jgi:hypothetical protein
MPHRTVKLLSALCVALAAVAGICAGAQAAIIHVPGDQPTIQAGIDAAVPGDVVLVAPGSYHETITLREGIEVTSESGPAVTTIVGTDPDVVVIGADESRIAGFQIAGSTSGIRCSLDTEVPTSPVIEDNLIRCTEGVSCHVPYQMGPTAPIIRRNLILSSWKGIYLVSQAFANGGVNATIENNTIIGCTVGIQYRAHLSVPTVEANIVSGCQWGIEFTYCSLFEQRTALIWCNDVWGNGEDYWVDEQGCGPFDMTGQQGNFSVDPLFCDPLGGDYGLHEGSPCLPGGSGGCGLVGAFPAGCGVVAVSPTSWGAIKASFR